MSHQSTWDAAINARADRAQVDIDRLTSEKATLDTQLANLGASVDNVVVGLRRELTSYQNILAYRLTDATTRKNAVLARLYASLTANQQAAVETVCDECDAQCLVELAESGLCPETLLASYNAALVSIGTLDDERKCRLFSHAISCLQYPA